MKKKDTKPTKNSKDTYPKEEIKCIKLHKNTDQRKHKIIVMHTISGSESDRSNKKED